MNTIKPLFIFLMMLTFSVNAEIFKCKLPNGEMLYQESLCSISETSLGQLKVKAMTPQEVEQAKALRKAEEQEEASYETENAKAEKQRQAGLIEQEKLALELRKTRAQEEQASAYRNRLLRYGNVYPMPVNPY
jgi:hypothetical protein